MVGTLQPRGPTDGTPETRPRPSGPGAAEGIGPPLVLRDGARREGGAAPATNRARAVQTAYGRSSLGA